MIRHYLMRKHLFKSVLVLGLAVAAAGAQDASPTPTPSPGPTLMPTPATAVRPEQIQGVPAVAPNYSSSDRSLPDLGRAGVDLLEQRSMTLRDALTMALENNKDIEVTRQNARIAEFDLAAARGVYEPRLAGQSYFERATVPNISFFTPQITKVTNRSIVANGGLTAFVPDFGTVLQASLNNNQLSTSNPVSIISPQLSSGFTASITQPLFRGRKFDQQRRTIEIAKRNLSLSDAQFRQRTVEIVVNVERSYWDLTFALRNLQVQRDSLRDALSQLQHNRRLVEEGQLAPIDIVAAETQVANLEQSVYEALNVVNQAENNLKNLIAPTRTDTIWAQAITPVEPVEVLTPPVSLPDAVNTALQNRPELDVLNVQKEINQVDQRFFREQKKPQIDLVASYTSSGVGGSLNPNFSNPLLRNCTANPALPECVSAVQAQQALLQNVGGAGTSFTDILANKYPTVRVGVQFNIPLFGDKTAKAQLGRSLVEGQRIETQREQLEQSIQVDVRNSVQTVRTFEARLRSAAIARENSQRQYESEQRKLDEGQSDVYRVLERQTALTLARSNELRARTDLNKAIAELERATGNSLQAKQIETKIR
jgi:outer membrane protein TolC